LDALGSAVDVELASAEAVSKEKLGIEITATLIASSGVS